MFWQGETQKWYHAVLPQSFCWFLERQDVTFGFSQKLCHWAPVVGPPCLWPTNFILTWQPLTSLQSSRPGDSMVIWLPTWHFVLLLVKGMRTETPSHTAIHVIILYPFDITILLIPFQMTGGKGGFLRRPLISIWADSFPFLILDVFWYLIFLCCT